MTGYHSDHDIYALVGSVLSAEASASQQLTQFAGFLCDTDLVLPLLDSEQMTIGTRIDRVRSLVKTANSHPRLRHAIVDESMRLIAVDALKVLGWLTDRRNVVAHYAWTVQSDGDGAGQVVGDGPAVMLGQRIATTKQTFVHIGNTYYQASGLLNLAGWNIDRLRRMTPEEADGGEADSYGRPVTPIQDAHRKRGELLNHWQKLKAGRLDGWRWDKI